MYKFLSIYFPGTDFSLALVDVIVDGFQRAFKVIQKVFRSDEVHEY